MTLTPDEEAAKSAGYSMPEGDELMSGGDDAIRTNGVKVYKEVQGIMPRLFARGTAVRTTNWDTYTTRDHAGFWNISRNLSDQMTGLPEGFDGQHGMMLVLGSVTNVATQMYFPYGALSTMPLIRFVTNAVSIAWNDWAPLAGDAGGATEEDITASIQHEVRRAQFVHAMGGPINTGGIAAVALRCDHGLTNFRDKVLPRTKAAGIKVSQAYNPRNWDYAENAGVTPADLNGWVEDGDVEIWNHSASHQGAEDVDKLYDEIVNGKAEIEAQLPAAAGNVWGFVPPGVTVGDYMGFGTGASPEQWGGPAARLMMTYHAVVSAYLSGTELRVLDGQTRDGLDHYGIESRTVAQIKARIDDAIEQRRGLQLMLHPSQLDLTGKLTTTGLQQVLDYLVTKREAGELVTLSPYQIMVADSTTPSESAPEWSEITGKPATYPPAPHTHEIADVTTLGPRLEVLEQDTGDLDITPSVPEATQGHWTARRVGPWVYMNLYDLGLTPTSGSVWSRSGFLPVGFRPPATSQYVQFPTAQRTITGFTPGPFRVDRYGGVTVYGVTDKLVAVTASWVTNDPFPDSVPWEPARALWDPRTDIDGAAADSLDFLDDPTDQEEQT